MTGRITTGNSLISSLINVATGMHIAAAQCSIAMTQATAYPAGMQTTIAIRFAVTTTTPGDIAPIAMITIAAVTARRTFAPLKMAMALPAAVRIATGNFRDSDMQ